MSCPSDLRLRFYPDPILKQRAKNVTDITDELRAGVQKMFDVMYEEEGIGIAAPQVGWSERLFVINLTADEQEPDEEWVFINPVVTDSEGEASEEEGCLSIPDIRVPIKRPETITIEATNLDGKRFRFECNDLMARCIQHELDHLDGILFIDRAGFASKVTIKKALKQMAQDYKARSKGD